MTRPVEVSPGVPVKGTKAVVAAIGGIATAVLTWTAAVAVVADDDRVDIGEVGTVLGATAALVSTVIAVYRTRNAPKV